MATINRRQGEAEKKKLTPPKQKPPVPKPPHVREGDILLLGGTSGLYPTVGVVVQVASGKMGSHRLVDAEGRDREVTKNPNSMFSQGFGKKITVVGHDDEWLKLEKGLSEKRRKFAAQHQREANRVAAEMRKNPS